MRFEKGFHLLLPDTEAIYALSVADVAQVDQVRCVGCGVCTLVCPEGALSLVRRPEDQVLAVPVTEGDWMAERAAARGIELDKVL